MDKKKWEQENVLRLVKKSRKGVLRVVFSRFGLMALLLILELVLLWMMWRWFNNDFEWFAAVQGVFTVLMFFHLFNSDMDATGKLTWMFLLAVIPIPASIFLWFTEKDAGHRTLKRRVQQRIDESRDLLHQDPEVLRTRRSNPPAPTICAAISTAAALFPCMPTRRRSSSHRERTSLRRCWRSCKRRRSSFFWSTSSLTRGICGAAF